MALLLCLSGCGRETIEIPKEIKGKEEVEANETAETPDRSELKMEDEKPEEIEPEETDEQKEIVPAVREIPVQALFVRKWITSHLLWQSWRNLPENMS